MSKTELKENRLQRKQTNKKQGKVVLILEDKNNWMPEQGKTNQAKPQEELKK